MAKYCVFESSNMAATHFAERIFDCVSDKDVENGTFGYLGDQTEEGSHIYKFVPGFKDGEKVVVADQPAWDYDTSRTSNQRRDKFIIPAGMPFRVRVVKRNDEFGITIEGVTEASREKMKIGAFLTIDKTGKLVASDKAAADSEPAVDNPAMEAKVVRKRMIGATLVTPLREYGYENAMYEARVTILA